MRRPTADESLAESLGIFLVRRDAMLPFPPVICEVAECISEVYGHELCVQGFASDVRPIALVKVLLQLIGLLPEVAH